MKKTRLLILSLVILAVLIPAVPVAAAPQAQTLPWTYTYTYAGGSMSLLFTAAGGLTVDDGENTLSFLAEKGQQFDGVYYDVVAKTITQTYKNGKLSIIYDVSKQNGVIKITYKGNNTGKISIPLAVAKGSAVTDTGKKQHQAKGATKTLAYDWSDAPGMVDVKGGSIEFSTNGAFNIDPAIIGTSTSNTALQDPWERSTFYAAGRHWVFYSDGTDYVWRTSTDGVSWTAVTILHAGASSQQNAIWYNGSKVYFTNNTQFAQGTPQNDGSIVWDAPISAIVGAIAAFPSIAVDSNGYPWSGYNSGAPNYFAMAVKSTTDNGTFVQDVPLQLTTTTASAGNVWSIATPISSGSMVFVYGKSGAPLQYRRYYSDNTSWGVETQLSALNADSFGKLSVIAYGDTVVTAYSSSADIYIITLDANTGLKSEVLLDAGVSVSSPALSVDTTNQVIYCFFREDTDTLKYYLYHSGTWSGPVNIGAYAVRDFNIGSNSALNSGYVELVYEVGAGSPYDIYHTYIGPPVVTTDNTSYSIDKDGTLSGTFGMTLSDNGTAPALVNAFGWGASDASAPYVYARTAYATDNNSTVGYKQSAFSLAAQVPTNTYYYRAGSDFRGWGIERSFTIAAPTTTTTTATNSGSTVTLNGNITSMGNASSVYAYFEYGLTTAYGSSTTPVAKTATGTYGATITHPDYPKNIYYRSVVTVGTATFYGSAMTLTPATAAKEFNLDKILSVIPILIFSLVVIGGGVLAVFGWRNGNMIVVILGFVFIAVLVIMYPIIIAGIEGILGFIP